MKHLSTLLVLIATCSAPAGSDPADKHADLHLIPWPKSIERTDGHLRLTATSRIVAVDEKLKPLASVLSEEIAKLTGVKLEATSGPAKVGDIVLRLDPSIRAGEPILGLKNREVTRSTDGAHSIVIDSQATISGFDYRATAEGTATILQLLGTTDGLSLPKVTIKDWPHADYCGVMLDVARQDHPIDSIKKVVQLCRLYKARYLQLHLSDDQGWTFPSTKYPQLGSKNYGAHGGIAPRVYKLDELKALVAYADARGVTIVPEFEMPGHSGAASRSLPAIFDAINPQSGQPVGIGCMNMSNEDIYPAIDTLIGEMCDVFRSSPYFHIGSDEVTSGRLSLHPGYKAFLAKHGLKDEHDLADHFIASACATVKKYGKKAIKWEGLSNLASKDVIVMAWEGNSTMASELLAKGYTVITCPWNLGVPWDQWNMYVCNASKLKKGDSVLGATLVAWEQPWLFHVTSLRNLPARQERTWGPDNTVTEAGFAARFQPLDAVAGRLIELPAKPRFEAAVTSPLTTRDFLEPTFAFDGNDATFHQSARAPKAGDHLTLTFPQAKNVYGLEILTGSNRRGQLNGGEVRTSSDGTNFKTVATLKDGSAKVVLTDSRVRAVRIRAVTDQSEPLIVREINPRMLVEVFGTVRNAETTIGPENVAAIVGDTSFDEPIGALSMPIINRRHKLKLNSATAPTDWSGPISGTGTIDIVAGGPNAVTSIDGILPNNFNGTWSIRGQVALAKPAGVAALGGTIVVGPDGLLSWTASDQLNDAATVELLGSGRLGTVLELNAHTDTIARLTVHGGAKVRTTTGSLVVKELFVAGEAMPKGVYSASTGWLEGRGYVIVGDVKRVPVNGTVRDPQQVVGVDNLAILGADTTFQLPEGDCRITAITGEHSLTLSATGDRARFNGFIAGNGAVRIEGPLTIGGPASNSYSGPTTLERGEFRLAKPKNALAIPGDLNVVDGTVRLDSDGQFALKSVVTFGGSKPTTLNLNGHTTAFSKLVLSKSAKVNTGTGGILRLQQLFVDGTRLRDGEYRAPLAWLEGPGMVTVDSRVDIQGVIASPEAAIGVGNVGRLIGATQFGYPSAGGDFDILTEGRTLKLDSGDGNPFEWSGTISGTGNVEFYMGPSYTAHRDSPLRLSGTKPNTATGQFLVKKGRVQLEKPEGVDAISGDVTVGGQGFNDCLFWVNSHQINDSAKVTLLDAGNSGAAYMHLNGCQEIVASLTMTANNKVRTDSAMGKSGTLTVKALTISGTNQPAGTYSAANAKWLEGKGSVIVRP